MSYKTESQLMLVNDHLKHIKRYLVKSFIALIIIVCIVFFCAWQAYRAMDAQLKAIESRNAFIIDGSSTIWSDEEPSYITETEQ